MNIADKIRLAQSSALNLFTVMSYYYTNASDEVTPEEIESDAAAINKLLSNAGLSVYVNNSSTKNADVRAKAGKIGNYNHVRFGLQFAGSDEVELVREIANPEDIQKIRTLVSSVVPMLQQLTGIISNSGVITNLTDNEVFQVILQDLLGTN